MLTMKTIAKLLVVSALLTLLIGCSKDEASTATSTDQPAASGGEKPTNERTER